MSIRIADFVPIRLSLCLAICGLLFAESTALAAEPDCAMPTELVVPQFAALVKHSPRIAVPRVFPIGWSDKGLFAWVTTEFMDNAGFVSVGFSVIDTRRDRGVDGVYHNYPASNPNEQTGALREFWKTFGTRVCKSLAAHDIVQEKQRFVALPYEVQGDTINVKLRPEAAEDKPNSRWLMCLSETRGEKRIATLQAIQTPFNTEPDEPFILGAIAHPNGERLLVLTGYDGRSEGGPPDSVHYNTPAGCDLTKSFQPRAN